MKTLLVETTAQETALRRCLCERGHEVVVCTNTAEAKERWQTERPPFVILRGEGLPPDLLEFCRWLRSQAGGESCYLLAVLISVGLEGVDTLIAADVDDVLMEGIAPAWVQYRLGLAERQVRQRLGWSRVEEALNTRAQEQVLVAALGQCALSEVHQATINNLLTLVTTFVMQMLEVEFCNVMELTEDGKSLAFVAGLGWRDGCIGQILSLPSEGSVLHRTLAIEDLILEDLPSDPRFNAVDFLREHAVTSGISVAVRGNQRQALGVLGAWTARQRSFSASDMHFLQSLAHVLGAVIEHRRLQRQIEHLQRLEAVGQLAAGLAHDYNNVLTIIHGQVTRVLSDPALPPKLADPLTRALQAVERAATLTRQLLTFSRKQTLQVKAVDLNEVVGTFCRLLDRVLGKDIQIEFQAGVGLPAVEADAGMLEQVVMNLAVNARDAMSGTGKLVLSTALVNVSAARAQQHPEAHPGDFISLKVSDNGCGMDAATMHRIFEPFFSTKGPSKGTGLGLATVYGIVKQHQGWIEVESKPGQGTTFSVFLPSAKAAALAPEAPPEISLAGHSHHTVLLVEDEPNLRELARLLLEELGYQVVEAASGEEALRLWATGRERIRVLLTDLVLPDGMSGFELADRLQREEPSLRVVLTSGYSADEVQRGVSGPTRYHFLQKPYRTKTLAKVMRDA